MNAIMDIQPWYFVLRVPIKLCQNAPIARIDSVVVADLLQRYVADPYVSPFKTHYKYYLDLDFLISFAIADMTSFRILGCIFKAFKIVVDFVDLCK